MQKPTIIKVHEPDQNKDFLDECLKAPALFACTIASTETALIPGVSAAGASPELIPYTAAADVEAIIHGRALCLGKIPENPLGPPSPVIITMAALKRLKAPFFAVDAGNAITPKVPMLVAGRTPGRSLSEPVAVANATELFMQGIIIGQQFALSGRTLILGESVPGGTTTAMAVMEVLGIAALGKISGSMPGNNQSLKQELVSRAMRDKNLVQGSCLEHPLEAVRLLGDPMQAVQAGIAMSASQKIKVILGGGTQMIAVAALIGALLKSKWSAPDFAQSSLQRLLQKAINARPENIAIATTAWVSEDRSADLRSLMQQLPIAMPLYAAGLDFSLSRHKNLSLYEEGYVKEGVGAGAMALAAMLYHNLDNLNFLPEIEKVYEDIYLSEN
ncbi:MAG: TIGR00303 family protein [Deltaproteobacteria bacterium]|nr:TIGR00303 family protein [Candidatus Tharpella sp.]